MSIKSDLETLANDWKDADAGERSNALLYLTQLCRALDVPEPQPSGSGYEFEYPISVVERDGTETKKPADLVREGYFLLEAKDYEPRWSKSASRELRRLTFDRPSAAFLPSSP